MSISIYLIKNVYGEESNLDDDNYVLKKNSSRLTAATKMPRKGRKYHNDEKVLDRLKIRINIIKCKKDLNLIKQDGKQQRAEEFPTRPHHLGKARKKVKTCKKSTNSQNVFLWSRMNFFS